MLIILFKKFPHFFNFYGNDRTTFLFKRIFREIVLMALLSRVVFGEKCNLNLNTIYLGQNWLWVPCIWTFIFYLVQQSFGNFEFFLCLIIYNRSVLRTWVYPLSMISGGVMGMHKNVKKLFNNNFFTFEWNYFRVICDFNNLSMTCLSLLNLFVLWVLDMSSWIPRLNIFNSFYPFEHCFDTPETSSSEICLSSI